MYLLACPALKIQENALKLNIRSWCRLTWRGPPAGEPGPPAGPPKQPSSRSEEGTHLLRVWFIKKLDAPWESIRESTNIRIKNPRKSEGKKSGSFVCVEEILQTDTPHSLQDLHIYKDDLLALMHYFYERNCSFILQSGYFFLHLSFNRQKVNII